jgi:hypothetical protein
VFEPDFAAFLRHPLVSGDVLFRHRYYESIYILGHFAVLLVGWVAGSYSDEQRGAFRTASPTTFFGSRKLTPQCPRARLSFVVVDDGLQQPAHHGKQPHPYILFFRNSGPENYAHLSPDERQRLMQKWNAWYDGLAKSGKAVEGQPLELETRLVSGAAARA